MSVSKVASAAPTDALESAELDCASSLVSLVSHMSDASAEPLRRVYQLMKSLTQRATYSPDHISSEAGFVEMPLYIVSSGRKGN